MDQHRRPSVYVQERAEALGRVFDFFTAPHRGQAPGAKELLVVFLAQLDFWEWELDNLVYAFTAFGERAAAWEHENGFGLANALRTRGIWVRAATVRGLKLKRQARSGRRSRVVAPVAALNRVLVQWNGLLAACEERVLIPAEECEAGAIPLRRAAALQPPPPAGKKGLGNAPAGDALTGRGFFTRGGKGPMRTRPCQRCGQPIPPERAEALPETRLCVTCSGEVGGDFEVTVVQENLAKAGSLKKNYGGLTVRKTRRRIEPKE